ncbi:MAG: hypothetical protein FWG63_00705 [Defluviitaleaceae bacterium]|nr:hypothetical protein [Defluviitaleaceae bacterium]
MRKDKEKAPKRGFVKKLNNWRNTEKKVSNEFYILTWVVFFIILFDIARWLVGFLGF